MGGALDVASKPTVYREQTASCILTPAPAVPALDRQAMLAVQNPKAVPHQEDLPRTQSRIP